MRTDPPCGRFRCWRRRCSRRRARRRLWRQYDSSSERQQRQDRGAPSRRPRRAATLTVLADGDVDYIDPRRGLLPVRATMIEYATQPAAVLVQAGRRRTSRRPTSRGAAPRSPTDGKTVTVQIKPGIKFGPPVNREVTSKDVKYAIERGFNKNVANGYAAPTSATSRAPRRRPRRPTASRSPAS